MMIEEIAKKVRLEVLEALASQPWVNVAVDGWEDHQKHPTLAFTVSTPSGKTFLWQFDRIQGSQTGDALRDEVSRVCQYSGLGMRKWKLFSGMEIPEISIGVGNHFRKIGRCVEEIDPKFVVV